MRTARLLLLAAAGVMLASAQSITVAPTSLSFFYQTGSPTPPQQAVQVTITPSTTSTVTVTYAQGGPTNWLFVNPLGPQPSTPGYQITVLLFTTNLPAGTHTATIGVSAPGVPNPVNIPVTLTVSNLPLLVSSAPRLSFQFARNGQPPAPQTLGISATAAGLNFTAAAQTLSGGNWLSVTPTAGVAGQTGSAPTNLTVTATPGNLAVGRYEGNILVAAAGASNNLVIPVTFDILDELRLTVTPISLTYDVQVGAGSPPDRTITVTTGVPVTFTTTVATQTGGNWLSISPTQGTTPANITVSVNSAGLAPGTYSGTIAVNASGATNNPQTVGVTLRVSNDPLLSAVPSAVTFTSQAGGNAPAPQTVIVSNPGNSASITTAVNTASGGSWLSAVPGAAGTPTTIVIRANPQGLAPGVYTGNVVVTGTGIANSPFNIPVTFAVTALQNLRLSANNLIFAWQTGRAAPAAKTIAVSSTGNALGFNVATTTTSGGNWLVAAPTSATTPANVSVTVNTTGLAPGQYTGAVTIQGTDNSTIPLSVPVQLTVSNGPLLVVPDGPVSFSFSAGGALPPNQTVFVGSTGDNFNFTVSPLTSLGGSWLRVAPSTAATGTSITVGVDTLGLAEGTYTGILRFEGAGVANSPRMVPVTYTLSRTAELVVPTTPIAFTGLVGGSPPEAQTITVGSSGVPLDVNVTVQTLSGGNWLTVTPTQDLTPARLTVRANQQGLEAGTYSGTITINSTQATNSPRILPVTFTVTRPLPNITTSRDTIPFSFTIGGQTPPAQQLQITSSTADAIGITVAASTQSGGNWLTALSNSANTPATVTVTVNPAGLTAGVYNGAITITSAGAANSPRTVAVTLTVTGVAGGELRAFVNAATFLDAPAVPGMIVTLGGSGIGPALLQGIRLNAQGNVDTIVGNTRVLFDGVPAPIIYVSATQTSVVVPYSVAGRLSTRVQVEFNGVLSNALDRPVADANPGMFTLNSSGTGHVLALNAEAGTGINTAANPAPRGTVIVIYATGEGQTSPPGVDGTIPNGTTVPLRSPLLPVRVRIGGQEAQVIYAGSAPTFVSGVMQLNVRIPENAPLGLQPVELIIGSRTSPAGITLAIRQ